MAGEDVRQIKVGKNVVGIRGLDAVLRELSESLEGIPDDEIREILLDKLKQKNYIPERVREEYGRAFLREYKKFVGRAVDMSEEDGADIKIVGPGCSRCDGLERTVIEVLSELGTPLAVEHIRDPLKIGEMGIMGIPALIIGKDVVAVGSAPPKVRIKEQIEKYLARKDKSK